MAKNMHVPKMRALNVTKTTGTQSIILRISGLWLDTINCEEHRFPQGGDNVGERHVRVVSQPLEGILIKSNFHTLREYVFI